MNDYTKMLKQLAAMDAGQLSEMFHDLVCEDGLECVQKIFNTAETFLAKCEGSDLEGESEEVDWKRQDDAQRAREIKSDNWTTRGNL